MVALLDRIKRKVKTMYREMYLDDKLRDVIYEDIGQNRLDRIRALLEKGADPQINMGDFGGWPGSYFYRAERPMHWAAKRNNVEFAKLLQEFGANIHVNDFINHSTLHHAADHASLDMVRFLVENKANVNQRDKCLCSTPLHALFLYHRQSKSEAVLKEIADILLKEGADPLSVNLRGNTPIEYARWRNDKLADYMESIAKDPTLRPGYVVAPEPEQPVGERAAAIKAGREQVMEKSTQLG